MYSFRADLPELIASGDHRTARAELAAVAVLQPDVATCHRIVEGLEQLDADRAGLKRLRIALLSNYTSAPLVPLLKTQALPSGFIVATYVPGFDQWMPELLDAGSALRAFDPQVLSIDLLSESLAPALTQSFLALDEAGVQHAIDEIAAVIADAISALRSWSKARALIHLPARPSSPSLGILDASVRGQRSAFDRLEARLRELCVGRDAYCIDTNRLVADVGAGAWHDHRMWALGKIPYSTAAWRRIADEYIRFIRALTGRLRKVLVLDIDDTLWGGVLGERGEHGVALGETYPGSGFAGFQRAVAELKRRGVVLALNSANDADHVLDVLRRHPAMVLRVDDFAAHRINWQDKAANMVELADELGLGLDSFVFIDNSDAECARMRQALPEVLTFQLPSEPASYGPWLRALGVFDTLGFTDEDRTRAEMYRGEVQRSKHREAIGSLEDYLVSLKMTLTVERVTLQTVARAADLSQRTNQFNLTTRRRTASELAGWLNGDDHDAFVFALADRFGAQGIIGFAAVRYESGQTAEITDFMISCRALKRNVEHAMLAVVLEQAHRRANHVFADYVPTPRNAPFATFYPTSGLRRAGDSGVAGATRYEHAATEAIPRPSHIEVQQSALTIR